MGTEQSGAPAEANWETNKVSPNASDFIWKTARVNYVLEDESKLSYMATAASQHSTHLQQINLHVDIALLF